MSAEFPDGLDPQVLDDFFSEADEHLIKIRHNLVQMEGSVDKAEPDMHAVGELFQDFHSLKGISAMVGLGAAEALAHGTEDFLRLMRDQSLPPTRKGLESLTAATQKLEQIVGAFRSQGTLPDYESVLADLREQCGLSPISESAPDSNAGGDSDLPVRIEEARAHGLLLWKYTFSPTRELDAAGVNLNWVRGKLSTIGEILKAVPQVRGTGGIAFEFLVAAREAPTDLSVWETKGITVLPAEPGVAAAGTVGQWAEEIQHNPFLAPSHIVRVDLKQLDELMRLTGEMVIHRARLEAQLTAVSRGKSGADLKGVQETSISLSRSLRELREAIMRVRLVPVAEIFARMPFLVRDLARHTPKKARLKLAGQETAIDKYLIERLKDPILHLVRNAFSHGVETPEERAALSKPEVATIELSASAAGDSVLIRVADDGRGIKRNVILERARQLGLPISGAVDNSALLEIICSPGFSTRDDADRAAGRGVGMTVVMSTVRELGGDLALESTEGRGTRFTIRLPLTLAVLEALIVTAAGQRCAMPQSCVREILHTTEAEIQRANGVELIPYRKGLLPIIRLADLFRLRAESRSRMCLLVVTTERGSVGLLTEEVLGQREVIVRALRDPLIQVQGISGATELGDGKPVLILDGPALTRGIVRPPELQPHPNGSRN